MPKGKSGLTEIRKLKRALLREGARTYPQAMQALAEFRLEVSSICRCVAERRKNSICRLLGIRPSRAEIADEREEVDAFRDGLDANLSVAITAGNVGSFWIGPWWEGVGSTPSAVRVGAWLEFDRRATFEKVKNALQEKFREKVRTDDEQRQCWREMPIQPHRCPKPDRVVASAVENKGLSGWQNRFPG